MVEEVPPAVGLVLGVTLPFLFYADGYWDPQFMVVLGLTWTVSGWLMARNWRALRGASNRLGVLYVLLLVGVPTFGIHASRAISGAACGC